MLNNCPSGEESCYNNSFQNISNYLVNPNYLTLSGIQVDTEYNIDLSLLDTRIKNMENCLQEVAREISPITQEQKQDWSCLKNTFNIEPFKRECLIIKVVKPILSKCSDWQFIDVLAPKELCEDKNVVPTEECPCRWRVAIQDENILIVPPKLYLWDLGRIWSGCNNIWESAFVKCLNF